MPGTARMSMTAERDVNPVKLRAEPEALACFIKPWMPIAAVHGMPGRSLRASYPDNRRLLSRWDIRIDGEALTCATASAVDAASMLAYYLAPKFPQRIPGLTPEESGLALKVHRSIDD